MTKPDRDRLADLVRPGGVLVLSGAGISTDSGIPDYRGRDGIRRVMPMQYGEFVASTDARRRYWARSFVGWTRFASAAPNAGHRAVARLQQLGYVGAVVTQNVDGLHREAGSTDVVELHGTLAQVVCLRCGERADRFAVQDRMRRANPGFQRHVAAVAADGSQVSSQIRPDGDVVLADEVVASFEPPRCEVCGSDTVKPDVVFFGESVPKPVVTRCAQLVEDARSVLVLGSSLAVMSGFRLVRQALARGIPVAVVTLGPTRAGASVDLHLNEPLSPVLHELLARLGAPVPSR